MDQILSKTISSCLSGVGTFLSDHWNSIKVASLFIVGLTSVALFITYSVGQAKQYYQGFAAQCHHYGGTINDTSSAECILWKQHKVAKSPDDFKLIF